MMAHDSWPWTTAHVAPVVLVLSGPKWNLFLISFKNPTGCPEGCWQEATQETNGVRGPSRMVVYRSRVEWLPLGTRRMKGGHVQRRSSRVSKKRAVALGRALHRCVAPCRWHPPVLMHSLLDIAHFQCLPVPPRRLPT